VSVVNFHPEIKPANLVQYIHQICSPPNIHELLKINFRLICYLNNGHLITNLVNWGSSVSIVSDYRLDDLGGGVDPRQRQGILPLASVSRPDVRPIQPAIQWVKRVLPQG
jgi:hypothetical protein